MGEIRYKAAPTVARYIASDGFLDCIVGPIGSGKSAGSVIKMLRRWHRQPASHDGVRRSRWLIGRNSYRELKDTTLPTFFQWVPRDAGIMSVGDFTFTLRARGADGVPIEVEILFRSFDTPDDARKLLSLELTGFWFNEAREIARPIVDAATGRVGRFPRRADCPPFWYGGQLDTNPSDRLSWLYRMFAEDLPEGYRLFQQPGGNEPGAENLDNLPPGYYERIAAGKSDDWIAVYVGGRWGYAKEGMPIFPGFRDRTHVPEFPIPWNGGPVVVGIDFGLTPAAAIMQPRTGGGLDWIGELTTERAGALQFARDLNPFLASEYPGADVRVWADPAGVQGGQNDMSTCFDVLRAEGINAFPAPTNNFGERAEATRYMLAILAGDGLPGLRVSKACKVGVIGMGGGYRYRTFNTSNGLRNSDQVEKNHYSHVCEAAGYAIIGEGLGVRARGVSKAPLDYSRQRRATAA